MGSSALMRQLVEEKENSEFKPVKLRLKIDLVSYPARAEGLVNMVYHVTKAVQPMVLGSIVVCGVPTLHLASLHVRFENCTDEREKVINFGNFFDKFEPSHNAAETKNIEAVLQAKKANPASITEGIS